jgi:hypothetical protein
LKRSSLLLVSGTLFVVAAGGCQAIAGISSRSTDPPPAAGQCILPDATHGNGLIRLVNAGNTGTTGSNAADFCIKASGTSDWGRPIFRDGGGDSLCQGGLNYLTATVPFHVPVGSIDVKAIVAGQTCSASATSEKDGIQILDAGSAPTTAPTHLTTVMRYAGGSSAEAIAALPEEPGVFDSGNTHIRVVNALSGGAASALNFGNPTDGSTALPATLGATLFASPIPPGTAPPAQPTALGGFQVDAEGYVQEIAGNITYAAALASDATNSAIALQTLDYHVVTATLFIVGDPASKNLFPLRGLYCQDRSNQSASDGGLSAADAPDLEQCTLTALPTLSFDTWNVGLYGANSPFSNDRAKAIPAAIAARASTDVMCITEVDSKIDRQTIIGQALSAGFKYSYDIDTDVTTIPATTTQWDGGVPSLPINAPCANFDVTNAYNCLASKCAGTTDDGGVGGLNQSTGCIEQDCVSNFLSLYAASPSTPAAITTDICFDCIVLNVLDPTETIAQGQSICTTSAEPAYTFQGQTPLLLLSKYPFNSTKSLVLPATGLRRGVLKAQVQFEGNLAVDVFCAQLSSPQVDTSLPYVGPYGQDMAASATSPGHNGWEDEQDYEAYLAQQWVASEQAADKVPAVLTGCFYSSTANGAVSTDGGAGDTDIQALSPEVMGMLDNSAGGAFTRAEPDGYSRTCDTCPDNPYTPGSDPREFEPMFLIGFPTNQNNTNSEVLWATQSDAVKLTASPYEAFPTTGAMPGYGPYSEYYGHNWQIFRPATTATPTGDGGK